jgi:anaerobic magnesium-protoporphyrin IX monomethyl ester cyclase
MRFRRVLLVSPPTESRYGGLRVPAGIGYIAQSLRDHGIEHCYVDMRLNSSIEKLKGLAESFKPDLFGFSMITLGYKRTYGIIEELERVFPLARFVVGGHHVTILKDRVLEECKAVDFGVVGDGEKTIVELCSGDFPFSEIGGLIYRDKDSIYSGPERKPVLNLDEYSFPTYEGFNLSAYSRQIPVHSSRGCVYQCTFCPNKLIGMRYRTRSVESFVDEIEQWYAKGIRQFAIDDDNFAFSRKRVCEICEQIKRRGLNNLFIRCSNGLRADSVDKELLSKLKEIGVREIGFGVDGGNDRILRSLKKGETIAVIEQAIKDACDLGFDVKLFILVGTPAETLRDIEDSIGLARRYRIARVNFNNPIPYPGTELFEYVKKNKLFLVEPETYLNSVSENKAVPVFETSELPRAARIKILRRCHTIEKEIMRITASRIVGEHTLFGKLVKSLFPVGIFEHLFFRSLLFRNLFERIRYKKLMAEV